LVIKTSTYSKKPHGWVNVTFNEDDDAKAKYKTGDLIKYYLIKLFNVLYESFKTEGTCLSVSAKTGQPLLWADAAVYGFCCAHILT
jgi:hypothetical protein